MKIFKQIAVAAIVMISVVGAALYTSCSKDNCKSVTCLNGGSCGGGQCSCPTGIGGSECQTVYRLLYSNTYTGNGSDDTGKIYGNYRMIFSTPLDSIYDNMNLAITDSSGHTYNTFTITLSNNTASGSNFTINPFQGTAPDTATYTGTGSISATTASLNLTKKYGDSTYHYVSFNNFNKTN